MERIHMKNRHKSIHRLILIFFVIAASVYQVSCAPEAVRYTSDEIAGFPPNIQQNIREGYISLSMTPEEVRYAWGSPDNILYLPTVREGKEMVEWDYGKYLGVVTTRLIFVGGRLSEIISNDPKIKRR